MPVYLYGEKPIITNDGMVAVHEDCCCVEPPGVEGCNTIVNGVIVGCREHADILRRTAIEATILGLKTNPDHPSPCNDVACNQLQTAYVLGFQAGIVPNPFLSRLCCYWGTFFTITCGFGALSFYVCVVTQDIIYLDQLVPKGSILLESTLSGVNNALTWYRIYPPGTRLDCARFSGVLLAPVPGAPGIPNRTSMCIQDGNLSITSIALPAPP